MRKSVALFMTLSFLIVAFALIASIIKTYEKITSKNMLFISQNSVIIKNSLNVLKNIEVNSSQELEKIIGTFPISSKDGSFRAFIEIKPINSININDFLKNKKIDKNIKRVIEFLAYNYDIKDTLFLEDLILDTIDKDYEERSPYSEIALQKKFQNGFIDKKAFNEILNYYISQTNDKNVLKVPWEKFFNFKITQLYTPPKEIELLNEKNETNFNIISIEKVKNFFVSIDINYSTQNINIIYDIKAKKVFDIENNPVY